MIYQCQDGADAEPVSPFVGNTSTQRATRSVRPGASQPRSGEPSCIASRPGPDRECRRSARHDGTQASGNSVGGDRGRTGPPAQESRSNMPTDWQQLTRLTSGARFTVERVRLADGEVAIEGSFVPPPLALLSGEDQVFITAFVHSHGSIKEMERIFGVSYPTVKNRLNRISEALPLVEHDANPPPDDVLDRLGRGEITPSEAIERLSQ